MGIVGTTIFIAVMTTGIAIHVTTTIINTITDIIIATNYITIITVIVITINDRSQGPLSGVLSQASADPRQPRTSQLRLKPTQTQASSDLLEA